MSTISNKMDSFLDDELHKALSKLGYIFPTTIEDFKEIKEKADKKTPRQPERLKDPFTFLNNHVYKCEENFKELNIVGNYSQNFAQAAREGKTISEEIKKEMQNDKIKSRQKNNDN